MLPLPVVLAPSSGSSLSVGEPRVSIHGESFAGAPAEGSPDDMRATQSLDSPPEQWFSTLETF